MECFGFQELPPLGVGRFNVPSILLQTQPIVSHRAFSEHLSHSPSTLPLQGGYDGRMCGTIAFMSRAFLTADNFVLQECFLSKLDSHMLAPG